MSELVDDTKQLLINGNIDDFGKILHYNWNLKKTLSTKISDSKINQFMISHLRMELWEVKY